MEEGATPSCAAPSPLTPAENESTRKRSLQGFTSCLERLDCLEREKPEQWQHSYDELLRELRARERRLAPIAAQAAEDNTRLKRRFRNTEAGLDLVAKEELWLRLMHPLAKTPSALASVQGDLTFAELPHPDVWDQAMVERVRRMSTTALVAVFKGFLQECAMLLPKVEAEQALGAHAQPASAPSANHARLAAMLDLYSSFNQRVVSLVPEPVWRRRSLYDMEAMAPIELPSAQWRRGFLEDYCAKGLPALRHLTGDFLAVLGRLRGEYNALVRQHAELSGAEGLGVHLGAAAGEQRGGVEARCMDAGPSGGAGPQQQQQQEQGQGQQRRRKEGRPRVADWLRAGDADCRFHSVVQALRGNVFQQQLALKHWLHAMHHGRPVIGIVQVNLLMYPLALTAIDFVDILAEGNDAAQGPKRLGA